MDYGWIMVSAFTDRRFLRSLRYSFFQAFSSVHMILQKIKVSSVWPARHENDNTRCLTDKIIYIHTVVSDSMILIVLGP